MSRRGRKPHIPIKGRKIARHPTSGPAEQVRNFLLEQFTESDLKSWRRISRDVDAFNLSLFHALEAQRKLLESNLIDSLLDCTKLDIAVDNWWRIVDYKYSLIPLSPTGSLHRSGRFNVGIDVDPDAFPIFPALYVAESEDLARLEKFGESKERLLSTEQLNLRTNASHTAIRVNIKLGCVLDLTKPACLKSFVQILSKISVPNGVRELGKKIGKHGKIIIADAKELRTTILDKNWNHYPVMFSLPANSQLLGRMLIRAGFDGVLYPSARGGGNNIAIFIENMDGFDSHIEVADDVPDGAKLIRIDKNNCRVIAQESTQDATESHMNKK